ncbi:hypothetical protein BD309DRAFT_960415 [Dichomitus squalens]|uniref:Uncharacterized protein n=1 Tax=Dichomitus squalens TaxID=114155 RepID=A0A4Q9NTY7_9APHY|nr:hypothetical protein BD309DRAFT_960415 [Dichomitus squalens]TBU58586.1 hypothetical protein BD310DRAFT_926901 [Dichomitus squalens]
MYNRSQKYTRARQPVTRRSSWKVCRGSGCPSQSQPLSLLGSSSTFGWMKWFRIGPSLFWRRSRAAGAAWTASANARTRRARTERMMASFGAGPEGGDGQRAARGAYKYSRPSPNLHSNALCSWPDRYGKEGRLWSGGKSHRALRACFAESIFCQCGTAAGASFCAGARAVLRTGAKKACGKPVGS